MRQVSARQLVLVLGPRRRRRRRRCFFVVHLAGFAEAVYLVVGFLIVECLPERLRLAVLDPGSGQRVVAPSSPF